MHVEEGTMEGSDREEASSSNSDPLVARVSEIKRAGPTDLPNLDKETT